MLGLKKLISTSYASASKKIEYHQITLFEMNSPQYDEKKTDTHGKIFVLEKDSDASGRIDINDLEWSYLEGDGDFRSEEVRKLRDEADVIITNPPLACLENFFHGLLKQIRNF